MQEILKNDTMHYYKKNMQEDIIGITDENYNKIVEYEYDSWGNIITIKDNNGNIITDESHIGIINPFRYRSYYYDKETKLYYLNSRYYNPEWGRFINADGIINGNRDILGYNLYAHTSNIFIGVKDADGNTIMPTWNEIKNVAKKIIQIGTTVASSVSGAVLGTPTAASMFNKSMNNPNGKINSRTKAKLTNQIKESKEMKQALSECISNNNLKSSFTCSGSTTMNSTKDLHYSVNKADYIIKSKFHSLLNTTVITVTVSDTYDFPKVTDINSLTDAANKFGRFYQDNNLLSVYQWDITYKEYIFW